MLEENTKRKMGKITSITPQKKKGRVNIFIDGEYSFAVFESALVDFNLYKNKELSAGEIEKIKDADNSAKCLDKAYNFLSYRPRSEKEMRDKLKEKHSEELTESTINRLKEQKYLGDEAFVKFWVENRGWSRGPIALRNELVKKGVSKKIIDHALENQSKESDSENARKLVQSKSKYKNLTKNEAYKKVAPYLQRRGYPYEITKKIIEDLY